MCRAFKVPRSTLLNNLDRIGWKGAGVGQGGAETKPRTAAQAGEGESGMTPTPPQRAIFDRPPTTLGPLLSR